MCQSINVSLSRLLLVYETDRTCQYAHSYCHAEDKVDLFQRALGGLLHHEVTLHGKENAAFMASTVSKCALCFEVIVNHPHNAYDAHKCVCASMCGALKGQEFKNMVILQ